MRRIVGFCFGFAFAFASSMDAKANPGVQGAGSVLCRIAEQNWRKDGANLFTWGQGFMSGLNILRYVGGKEVVNLDPGDFSVVLQIAYIRTYCRSHPEDEAANAFYELFKDIAQHHGATFP